MLIPLVTVFAARESGGQILRPLRREFAVPPVNILATEIPFRNRQSRPNAADPSRGRNGPKRELLDEFGIATLDGPASASQQNSHEDCSIGRLSVIADFASRNSAAAKIL